MKILSSLKYKLARFCRGVALLLDPNKDAERVVGVEPKDYRNEVKVPAVQPTHQPDGARDSDDATNDFYKLICSLADFHDELQLAALDASSTSSTSSTLSMESMRQKLADKMELADVLIIKESNWDASRQRPVKIASEDGCGIKVISSVSSGVCYRGKVIRKEEVIISK